MVEFSEEADEQGKRKRHMQERRREEPLGTKRRRKGRQSESGDGIFHKKHLTLSF